MDEIQAMINGMNMQWQRERASSQMTLGCAIKRLEEIDPEVSICGLGELGSYRGYYCDLAFEPNNQPQKVGELLIECKSAMGRVFTGYKGGEYMMGELTPLWVASYGCCGKRLMSIGDDGNIELSDDDSA